LAHDGVVLAHPCGADHGTEPSYRRERGHYRVRDWLPWLQLLGTEELRRGWGRPEGKRLQHLVVRQDAQRTRLDVEPGGGFRPVAYRSWLRVLLRLSRRRQRSMAPGVV